MSWEKIPLGKTSAYPEQYSPELLCPLDRGGNRAGLGLDDGSWPWFGADIWNAYELSWLQPGRMPGVAMARIRVPASSPCLVESKSLKLYLNSFSASIFPSVDAVSQTIEHDLSRVAGAGVKVELLPVDASESLQGRPPGVRLIDNPGVVLEGHPDTVDALTCRSGDAVVERLCSHLLRSLCPVTGQPDWGSLVVEYRGLPIDEAGLLRYLVGFRQQQDFHEHCVERIFMDLMARCQPEWLRVRAFYTRRGGLDINPWRGTDDQAPQPMRLRRQ